MGFVAILIGVLMFIFIRKQNFCDNCGHAKKKNVKCSKCGDDGFPKIRNCKYHFEL